ncbi:MAG: helix-turn-helix domain-containing protein [Methanothrix sp.]
MKTAYKFQLYPNKQQEAQLTLTLETCRHYSGCLMGKANTLHDWQG